MSLIRGARATAALAACIGGICAGEPLTTDQARGFHVLRSAQHGGAIANPIVANEKRSPATGVQRPWPGRTRRPPLPRLALQPNSTMKPVGPFSGGTTSDPVLVDAHHGGLEALERGGENLIWWAHYDTASGTWSRFSSLGGATNFHVLPGSSFAAVANSYGNVAVFAVGTDSKLYGNFLYRGHTSWTDWKLIDAASGSAPVAAAFEPPSAQGVLFQMPKVAIFRWRTPDGINAEIDMKVGTIEFDPSSWGDWTFVGNQAVPVSAAATADGKVELLCAASGRADGADGLHFREFNPTSGWASSWLYLGDPGYQGMFRASIFAVSPPVSPPVSHGANLYVTAVSDDRHVLVKSGSSLPGEAEPQMNPSFDDLGEMGFDSHSTFRPPSVTAASLSNGPIELFAQGPDYGLYRRDYPGDSGWTPLQPCMQYASAVSAVSPAQGDIELLFPSIDGVVYHQSLTRTPGSGGGATPTQTCPAGDLGQLCRGDGSVHAPTTGCSGASFCDTRPFPQQSAQAYCAACGGQGQLCCSPLTGFSPCSGTLQCQNHQCVLPPPPPPACGGQGQKCCPASSGKPACSGTLQCQNNQCVPPPPPPQACGGQGQKCCKTGRACSGTGKTGGPLICSASGTCNECGGPGETCCQGAGAGTCRYWGLACDPFAKNTCQGCGSSGYPCCKTSGQSGACDPQKERCWCSSNMTCAQQLGQPPTWLCE